MNGMKKGCQSALAGRLRQHSRDRLIEPMVVVAHHGQLPFCTQLGAPLAFSNQMINNSLAKVAAVALIGGLNPTT